MNLFEAQLLESIGEWFGCRALDVFFSLVSLFGEGGIFLIVCGAAMLFWRKTRLFGCAVLCALVFDALLVNVALKPLCARVRPYDFLPSLVPRTQVLPHDFSFPSGHTAAAFAAAGAMSLAGRRIYIPCFLFAALIGVSRIYLCVHYPSDVLAGAVLGLLCGYASAKLWQRLQENDKIKRFL